MANGAQAIEGAAPRVEPDGARCANCGDALRGHFCSRCGQEAVDLHRPLKQLLADVVGDVFSLDTRLLRTVRPLLFKPGQLASDYVAGRRMAHVPPLRSYLTAAFIFFGVFALFPARTPVKVFVTGSAEAAAARKAARGTQITFDLPERMPFFDDRFQQASARARANPELFASAVYANVPRVFFLFLPIFALLLELFYRKGFYLDHLVFSLYYHAFVFLNFTLLFLAVRSTSWLPRVVTAPVGVALVVWLVAYLPMALRRVYGESRWRTSLKLVALGLLYFAVFLFVGLPLIVSAGLARF